MARENKLGKLRQQRCGLSQGQVAIQMGKNRDTGISRDVISKFENGTTKSWDLESVMSYCAVTGIRLDEVVTILYPNAEYLNRFCAEAAEDPERDEEEDQCEKQSENQGPSLADNDKWKEYVNPSEIIFANEDDAKRRHLKLNPSHNHLIIGAVNQDRVISGIIPAIRSAMEGGRTTFAVIRDACPEVYKELIRMSETEDVVVCTRKTPLNWLTSVREPAAMNQFSKIVAARAGLYGDAAKNASCVIWNGLEWSAFEEGMEAKRANKNLNPAVIADECYKYMIYEADGGKDKCLADPIKTAANLIKALGTFCGNDSSPNISDCIRRGAAIVYLISENPDEAELLNAELALRQFMRICGNVWEGGSFWELLKKPKFTVIIDDLPGILPDAASDLSEKVLYDTGTIFRFIVGFKTLAGGIAKDFVRLTGKKFQTAVYTSTPSETFLEMTGLKKEKNSESGDNVSGCPQKPVLTITL